jgi:hypothetical protein
MGFPIACSLNESELRERRRRAKASEIQVITNENLNKNT